MRWVLLTLLPLTALAAENEICSLDGTGNVALCERTYWRSRIAAVAVPSYSFATDGSKSFHGVVWNLAFDLPSDFWSSYFTLGGKTPPPAVTTAAFQLSFGAAVAWYPTNGEVVGRLAIRTRIVSLAWPRSPALSFVHISVGLGGFVNRDGPGPRLELRVRLGHLAWGGLAIAFGYQPNVAINRHVGDLSIGFEAPWMWWW